MTTLTESAAVRRINAQVPGTTGRITEEQRAVFRVESLSLLEEAKGFVSRCASPRAQELSKVITEFIARERRKNP